MGRSEQGSEEQPIGYVSNIVIGVASTAPAYSLAATLAHHRPTRAWGKKARRTARSFIPIFLISLGHRYLNKADPDAGRRSRGRTRGLRARLGWLNGWAIFPPTSSWMALARVHRRDLTPSSCSNGTGRKSTRERVVGCVLWIWLMTWICHRGIELSARIQQVLALLSRS